MKTSLLTTLIIVLLLSFLGCAMKQQRDASEQDAQVAAVETEEAVKTEEPESPAEEEPETQTITESDQTEAFDKVAVITTNKGDIVIELYPDSAPKTVENFNKLIGMKFYDGLTFHRYEPGFVIQGGRRLGRPAQTIPGEFQDPKLSAKMHKHDTGTIAMARVGGEPDSATSQFYICLTPQPGLDGDYTTFGQVITGMDVVQQLRQGDVMKKIRLVDKSKYAGE